MHRHSRLGLTLLLAAALLFAATPAWACPSCKAALASQQGGGDLVQGFFWSILFLMSMPFVLLGAFSGYMYLLVRRARASGVAPVSTVPSRADVEREEADEPVEV